MLSLPTMPTEKFPKALKMDCFVFLKSLFVFEGRKDEFSRSVSYANINSEQQSQHQGSELGAAPIAHTQSIADFPPHSTPCRAGATPRSVVRRHCLTLLRELKIPVTQRGRLPCQACAQLFGPSNAHSSTKPPEVQRLQGPSHPLMKIQFVSLFLCLQAVLRGQRATCPVTFSPRVWKFSVRD